MKYYMCLLTEAHSWFRFSISKYIFASHCIDSALLAQQQPSDQTIQGGPDLLTETFHSFFLHLKGQESLSTYLNKIT